MFVQAGELVKPVGVTHPVPGSVVVNVLSEPLAMPALFWLWARKWYVVLVARPEIKVSRLVRNVPFLDSLGMSPFHVVDTVVFTVEVARVSIPREWAI